MPKRRYERREPTHEWRQIRPLLKDSAQIKYELIRPVILWGVNVKERAAETGEPRSIIYHQANLFDQAGMASLLPPEPPPSVPKLDKRSAPRGPRAFPEASRRRGALRWASARFRLSWLGPHPMSISTMITHVFSWREQCSSPVKRL